MVTQCESSKGLYTAHKDKHRYISNVGALGCKLFRAGMDCGLFIGFQGNQHILGTIQQKLMIVTEHFYGKAWYPRYTSGILLLLQSMFFKKKQQNLPGHLCHTLHGENKVLPHSCSDQLIPNTYTLIGCHPAILFKASPIPQYSMPHPYLLAHKGEYMG